MLEGKMSIYRLVAGILLGCFCVAVVNIVTLYELISLAQESSSQQLSQSMKPGVGSPTAMSSGISMMVMATFSSFIIGISTLVTFIYVITAGRKLYKAINQQRSVALTNIYYKALFLIGIISSPLLYKFVSTNLPHYAIIWIFSLISVLTGLWLMFKVLIPKTQLDTLGSAEEIKEEVTAPDWALENARRIRDAQQ